VNNQDRENANGRPVMATVLKASEARPETTANTLRGCGRALSCGVVSFLLGVVMLGVVANVEAKKRLCHLCPDPVCSYCPGMNTALTVLTRLTVAYLGDGCIDQGYSMSTTGTIIRIVDNCGREGEWGRGTAFGGAGYPGMSSLTNSGVDLWWHSPGEGVPFVYRTNVCPPWAMSGCRTQYVMVPVMSGECSQQVIVCDVELY